VQKNRERSTSIRRYKDMKLTYFGRNGGVFDVNCTQMQRAFVSSQISSPEQAAEN
jgi:hypothetical protein